MKRLSKKTRAIVSIVMLALAVAGMLYLILVPGPTEELTYARAEDENGEGFYTVTGIEEYTGTKVVIAPRSGYGGTPVTVIGEGAFKDCENITTIVIPATVTTISSEAFSGCTSLESITIPASVTSIADDAFDGCTNLVKIKVNKKNENYKAINGSLYSKDGTYLVRYAGEKDAESFAIPAGVTSINSLAFSYSAKTVTLPSSLETIGTVFSGLQELEIIIFEQGCQIKELGYDAFHGCSNLKTITIPASVTNISWYAFFDCTALESVYFEENSQLIEIGPYAFMNCTSLRSITIPEGTTNIGYCAFSYCSALEEVTIPTSVSTIEEIAFKDCTNLKNVKMSSPKWSLSKKEESAGIFQNTTSDTEEIWAKYLTEDFVDFCWRKAN